MSLILFDGFEDSGVWTAGGSIIPNFNTGGRNGKYMQCSGNAGVSSWVSRSCRSTEEHATFIIGFAFRTTSYTNATDSTIATFASDANTTNHIGIGLNANTGKLAIVIGGSTTIATTASSVIGLNTWHYIEFKATLHDTTGSYDVIVDGVSVLSATNVDTKNAGTKTVFDTIRVGRSASAAAWDGGQYDDLYWLNGAGTVNNNFLGTLAVETIYPNGMDTTAWVGSDGDAVNNHLLIDEPGEPSMTDYTYSSTVGSRELYTLSNLIRTTGSVQGISVAAHATKSDAAARGLKLAIKEGGGAQRQSADNPLSVNPASYVQAWDRKNDNSVWTISDVNSLIAGVEVGS